MDTPEEKRVMTRWYRLTLAAVVVAVLVGITVGCSSSSSPVHEVPCTTLRCMQQEAADRQVKQCLRALRAYDSTASRKEKAAIRARYPYPLTSEQSYQDWIRLGGTGMSPWAWCRAAFG